MHSASNSNTFLAHFNRLDSFLGIVLGIDVYMPFGEKVDQIAEGHYPVSNFVKKYQHKLKYFGDLRNQLVHGFHLDQHHYLLASDYAVQQIKTLQESLVKPPEVSTLFTRDLPVCTQQTSLSDAIQHMRQASVHYLPIYNNKDDFITILSDRMIVWFLDTHPQIDTHAVSISEVVTDLTGEFYLFMSSTTSIYEIEGLFAQEREVGKELAVVFLTASGTPHEAMEGYITATDLPKITEAIIL